MLLLFWRDMMALLLFFFFAFFFFFFFLPFAISPCRHYAFAYRRSSDITFLIADACRFVC